MKIIVTGATGQYGRAVTELLLNEIAPEDLILATRKPEQLASLAAQGVKVRYCDFDEAESLAAAFDGGERMLLISTARVGKRVGQHGNAVSAAKTAGVKHIVYTSFIALHSTNPALATKDHRATEELLRSSGVAWTALRDSQYAEAAAEVMAPMALQSGRWLSSSQGGRIAMVSRADCVCCAASVLSGAGHENRIYEITGGELLSYRQICQMISELAGRKIEYVEVTDDEMYAMFDHQGVPREASDDPEHALVPWSSDDMVSFERALREKHFEIQSDHVLKLTGRPPTPLRDVLMAHRHVWP